MMVPTRPMPSIKRAYRMFSLEYSLMVYEALSAYNGIDGQCTCSADIMTLSRPTIVRIPYGHAFLLSCTDTSSDGVFGE